MGRMARLLHPEPEEKFDVEFVDRYTGTIHEGKPHLRGCFGDCEAMGFFPLQVEARPRDAVPVTGLTANRLEYERARREGRLLPTENGRFIDDGGWAWVKCPDCDGTGNVGKLAAARKLPRHFAKMADAVRHGHGSQSGLLRRFGPIGTRAWYVRWHMREAYRAFTWDPPKGAS